MAEDAEVCIETVRSTYAQTEAYECAADEECDARELSADDGWDELRRLARREEAWIAVAQERAALTEFRSRLEERW